MDHYNETISKFLETLEVDRIKDINYEGAIYSNEHCICGQRIQTGYVFRNYRNNKRCIVGKRCLNYITYYLGWK